MTQLINDIFLYENSCYESVAPSRKGVLRTIKGPIAEWENLNRNRRKYSEKLWDNVLESDYVKEQMENNSLFGEANHPSDRYEVDFSRVSHAIKEMHKVPDKKQVYGTIDILDTPLGNVLNTLYEYGAAIGYSSRAGGVLKERKGYIEVDEDSYHFVTFDAVPYPSVKAARPISEGAEQESSDVRLDVSEEVHSKLQEIIENSGKKDKEVLKSFIYSLQSFNLDKEIALLEGLNSETTGNSESLKDTTLCLLKESYRQVNNFRNEITSLKREIGTKDEEIKKITEEKQKELDDMTTKINEFGELSTQIGQKDAEIEKLRNTISETNSKLDALKLENEEIQILKEEVASSKLIANKSIQKIKTLEDNCNKLIDENKNLLNDKKVLEESVRELKESNKELLESTNLAGNEEFVEVNKELAKAVLEISQIQERKLEIDKELTSVKNELQKVLEENAKLKSDVGTIQTLNEEASKLQKRISEKEIASKSEIKKVTESYEKSLKELKTKTDTYKEDLVKAVSGSYGLTAEKVMSKLNEDFTSGDVYLVCEELSKSNDMEFELVEGQDNKGETPKSRLNTVWEETGSRRGRKLINS